MPRPGMSTILPLDGRTITERNRKKQKPIKPAKTDTENARDSDSPWRFHRYCRSSKSIYFCFSVSGIFSAVIALLNRQAQCFHEVFDRE